MKTQKTTSMLVCTALLCQVFLGGCSKNDATSAETTFDPRVIRLSAGIQATSKAAVNDGNTFTAAIAGWESELAVDYGVRRAWQTTSTITAAQNAGIITLDDPQFYSQNSAVKTYIKAWHPVGTLADDGTVTFGGKTDGTADVLLAGVVSGSAQEGESGSKTMAFSHMLTQLKFTVQGDDVFGTTTTVKSITIKDVGVPTGLDLNTDAVVYTTMGLKAPGIDGTQAITTTATIVGQPAMIRPITGKTFRIDVETSATTYRDVLVTVTDTDLKAGKAYTISLNFAGLGVSTQASVTQWDDTGTGSGNVDTD